MAKKKFYAVAKGSEGSKIYNTWDECKRVVSGYKGAIYKSFSTKEEAQNFIDLHANGGFVKKNISKKNILSNEASLNIDKSKFVEIYVDGSFHLNKKKYSYGMVVLKNDEVIHTQKGIGEDEGAAELRNVSGEMMGSVEAVKYCLSKGHENVIIYFDYQGIQSWAIGTWKRNNKYTKAYHEFMQEKMKDIDIKFVKVKGHSGDKYNDMADRLAKEALGIL